jgi:hypothetical protein
MDGYEIRALRPGDEASLLGTFNLVFGARDPTFEPRTIGEWRWAFEQNPAGQRVFVALHAGEVVAQYAALPQHVWIDGARHVFAQIVDSMVHPAHRSRNQRPSLFIETARAFFAEYGGADKDWVHYGWPIARVQGLGEQHLAYDTLRTQLVLVHDLHDAAVRTPGSDAVEVLDLQRFDPSAKWLWDRCADGLRASAIRDADYLNWRFANHPRRRYTMHGAFDAAKILRGLCIARRADFVQRNLWCIAEWLVPMEEQLVGEALLAHTLARAREADAHAVALILPEWSAWHRWFQERGFLAHPTPYRTVARPFHRRFDLHWLRSNWWYQWGDSDLV